MDLKSYSKINLTLKVTSKTRNSLHEIQSFYCWINLFDTINIKKLKTNKDKIIFKGPFIKYIKKKNSVNKLLIFLRKLQLISNFYSITITKNIPVFAGLGGGSSNAAFILKYLLKNRINHILLNKLVNVVGSDLRLFFKRQGFQKNLKTVIDFNKKQKFYFVLFQPNKRCSTKEIYSNVKKFSNKDQFNKNITINRNKYLSYLSKSRNDLQFIVERKHPIINILLKDINNEKGCFFSRMTGSGSVCYGLFRDQILAKKALNNLKKKYPKFWSRLAKTV